MSLVHSYSAEEEDAAEGRGRPWGSCMVSWVCPRSVVLRTVSPHISILFSHSLRSASGKWDGMILHKNEMK